MRCQCVFTPVSEVTKEESLVDTVILIITVLELFIYKNNQFSNVPLINLTVINLLVLIIII